MLEAFLPKVIPLLLQKMVYSEDDIVIFEAEEQEQNESVPDRPEDIKPIFHKAKGGSTHGMLRRRICRILTVTRRRR